MKAKNLFLLVIALAVLVGLARWNRSRTAGRAAPEAAQKLVAFDVNAADQITIASAGQTTVLARADEKWVVKNLWNYPADFAVIAENVRRLAGLEGLAIRGGEQTLAEFGLAPAATNQPGADLTAITFSAAGKELGQLALGAPRLSRAGGGQGGYPDGQFVRAGSGPVLVVKEFLGGMPRRPQDWAGKELVSLAASEIEYVMVQLTNGVAYGLLADTNGTFRLSDLKTNETMNSEAVQGVAGALQSLTLVNVVDPKSTDEKTGLAKPSTFVARLKSGLSYTVKLGHASAPDNGRIALVNVGYEKPETAGADAADVAKKAVTEQERLGPWTFVISDYTASNLTKPRADLLQPVTNTPPPAAEAQAPAVPPPPATP